MTSVSSFAFRTVRVGRFRVSRTALNLSLVASLALCVPALGYAAPQEVAEEASKEAREDKLPETFRIPVEQVEHRIFIGADSEATVVRISGTNGNRRLNGVADALYSSDAVNLSQLKRTGLIGPPGEDGTGPSILRALTFNPNGSLVDVDRAQLKNVADATDDQDAITLGQLKASGLMTETGAANAVLYNDDRSVVTLLGATGSLLTGVRDGRVEPGSLDAINGGQLASVRDALQKQIGDLDGRVDALESAPAQPPTSPVDPTPTPETPATGIDADGVLDAAHRYTDEQVADAKQHTDAQSAANQHYTDEQIAAAHQYTDRGVSSANQYTDNRINALTQTIDQFRGEVNQRFQRVDQRMNRIGAMGAAMSQMVMSTEGLSGANRVGVGMGVQNGQSALAVGYSRALSNKARVSLGGSVSGSEASLGMGAGFSW